MFFALFLLLICIASSASNVPIAREVHDYEQVIRDIRDIKTSVNALSPIAATMNNMHMTTLLENLKQSVKKIEGMAEHINKLGTSVSFLADNLDPVAKVARTTFSEFDRDAKAREKRTRADIDMEIASIRARDEGISQFAALDLERNRMEGYEKGLYHGIAGTLLLFVSGWIFYKNNK